MTIKWLVKKAARKGVILATYLPVAAMRKVGKIAPLVRVLTYHRFGNIPQDPFCLDAQTFDAQMRWLSEQKLCISLDDLIGFLYERKPVRDGAVMVTIDDGYKSTHEIALPILKKYRLPSVAFVSAGIFDDSLDKNGGHEPYMTTEELRDFLNTGMSIGSHGLTHRSIGRMAYPEMRAEAEKSRAILEERTGVDILSFAYPYGTRADFSAESESALEKAGYKIGLTSQHQAVCMGSRPLSLPRIKIESGESLPYFKMICKGGLDAWKYADQFLFRLQKPTDGRLC